MGTWDKTLISSCLPYIMNHATPPPTRLSLPWQPVAVLLALGGALAWAYWPALLVMKDKWSTDPQYSHGFLVPVFAAALLWIRRPLLAGVVFRPSWWSVPLLALGIGMRPPAEAFNFAFEFLEGISLLLTLAGLCLLLGGRPALRWAWPAILFLGFMFPLPFNVERLLSVQLRQIATLTSTYVLQVLGVAAAPQGNTILLDARSVGVEEACSGLSMLMTFVALSTAVVFIYELPVLDKVILLFSSIPIAVIANVVRITGTALLMDRDPVLAQKFFHDWAGWLMMVLAFALLVLEIWLLRHLFVKVEHPRPTKKPLPVRLGA